MSLAEDDVLFGRIALHYKLVTPDQLNEAAALQAQEGGARRLGDVLADRGILTAVQLQKLLAVQEDYIAKRDAAAQVAAPAASQMTEPAPGYVPAPEPAP